MADIGIELAWILRPMSFSHIILLFLKTVSFLKSTLIFLLLIKNFHFSTFQVFDLELVLHIKFIQGIGIFPAYVSGGALLHPLPHHVLFGTTNSYKNLEETEDNINITSFTSLF